MYMQQVLGVWNSFFRGSVSGTASTTSRARYGTTHIWRRKVDIHGQVSEISLFSYITRIQVPKELPSIRPKHLLSHGRGDTKCHPADVALCRSAVISEVAPRPPKLILPEFLQ